MGEFESEVHKIHIKKINEKLTKINILLGYLILIMIFILIIKYLGEWNVEIYRWNENNEDGNKCNF